MDIVFRENDSNAMFELLENKKKIGEMQVILTGDGVMNIKHTEVDTGYEGQGLARKLVQAGVDYARENNLKIQADCKYAGKVLSRDETNKDLLITN